MGGVGSWIARAYDEDCRIYRLRALGSYGELPSRDRFAEAKQAAEAFAAEVERGVVADRTLETVADACERFVKSRPEDRSRFRRMVYADPLANVKLSKLRRSHLAAWRERLEAKPALVSRRKTGTPTTRPRSPATINREMALLRTALGRVLPLGMPNTEAAWQEALKPIKNATRRRTLYLTMDERRTLFSAVSSEAKPFIHALCLLPLRPGATAALSVSDFDGRTSELTIGKDKAGNQRRILVPKVAVELFSDAAKGKLPTDPMFTRANGKAWTKETWNEALHSAAELVGLPREVTAYTFRHSTITDLVNAGLPLLTIAQISGTSAEMIEKHYGHLVRHAAVEALAGLAL
jgi:integrase